MMEMVHGTCPHCDRFQTTNKGLAIITYGKNTIPYAKEFLGWTRDITVFVQRNYQLTDKDRNDAKTLGIKLVENDDIIKISGDNNGCIEMIVCQGGKSCDIGYKVQNELAKQLGCELDDEEGSCGLCCSQWCSCRRTDGSVISTFSLTQLTFTILVCCRQGLLV